MAGRNLRIFTSSPGDVGEEKVIAGRVVQRLKGEFDRFLTLEPIQWEHEPLRDRTARLWPYFATTQGLIDDARGVLPQKTLSADQRARFFLDAD